MRPLNEIEKLIRQGKQDIKTGEQMDNRTLHDSYAAMEKTIESTSKDYKTGMFEFIFRNKVTKLIAAAAAIILVVGLFLGRDGHTPEIPAPGHQGLAQPETRLISMMSMRASYQRGGFDALDQQFRETLDVLGPRSSGVSMKELLEGINGS